MIDLHSGRVLPIAASRFGAASQKHTEEPSRPAAASTHSASRNEHAIDAAPALRRLVHADRRIR